MNKKQLQNLYTILAVVAVIAIGYFLYMRYNKGEKFGHAEEVSQLASQHVTFDPLVQTHMVPSGKAGRAQPKKDVVLFYANWCGACKAFLPIWNMVKGEFESHPNINVIELEHGQHKDLMTQMDIQAFPTLRVYDGRFQESTSYKQYPGHHDRNALRTFIQGCL